MSPEAVLAPLLAQQAGVVTLGQAVAAGVSASSVHRLETALVLPEGSAFLDRALQRYVRFPTLYRPADCVQEIADSLPAAA